eukprot:g6201.t1
MANGPWRMCITVHNPEAPADFKQMEVGVADASKAKGGGAVNAWQLKANGEPDSVRFECPSGSYHIIDEIGTGTTSHAHHQAIVREALLPVYGALTTFKYTQARQDRGEADYSEEERGLDKSTRELKAEGGATLGTGVNQVGSAPSNGAAATARRSIPGTPSPARAHGFCFGLGADGEGLAEKLKQMFAGKNGFGKGPITTDGCNTPKFGEAGVSDKVGRILVASRP